ncbi:MAG: hypothetical protein ACRD2E_09755 [Terriglobales bacterium]
MAKAAVRAICGRTAWLAFAVLAVAMAPAWGQQFNAALLAGLRWRQVGPFRGGRVSAVAGVAGRPGIFYMGSAGGGVWKTVDGGTVWKPIFDAEPVASIGAIAVAPSNARILYVGTGNVSDVGGALNDGHGVYRSDDGGRTWRYIGLGQTRHIGAILVDPKNPDVVLVAALGQTYRKNAHRGVYVTRDGGRTWQKTLYKDDVTGAIDLAFDAARPGVVYAALWRHYVAPPPAPFHFGAAGGAIYKSTDDGQTWTQLTGSGLPTTPMGRIGLAADDGRVFAIVGGAGRGRAAGLYRSDDGGQSWRRITQDPRIVGSSYFSHVWMDPQNRDIVFVAQTSLYRSVDGGQTFAAYKGAPGGDDYHQLWIDPSSPCVPLASGPGCVSSGMILGSDQGASVSFDGGRSWSTWYNQPTGQFYHLSTDGRFPFRIYGTQQDSGSVEVRSRGAFGDINFLDWRPSMGAYEFGYIVPDPAHPQWIFASGAGPQLDRMTRGIWQILDVSPHMGPGGPYRYVSSPPFVFSPQNGNVLYLGTQYLLATTDGGRHWRRLGPDLARRPNLPPRRSYFGGVERQWGAISAIAPSPAAANVVWVGTNDGVVQVSRDGGKGWTVASPPGLGPYDAISMIAASPRDPAAAYAVLDRHEFGDYRPYIYRTRDFGQSWQLITTGIPDGAIVRVVRADPRRAGLLYAGTETGVYVSFNDGGQWQSLQLNLPTVSVRDLAIRDGDLVAATYGRAFWILDDLSPLRQLTAQIAAAPAHLFAPRPAFRLLRDANYDTPLPPEIPAGTNPPSGAILDYSLSAPPAGPIALAIYDASGQLVRRFTSSPLPAKVIRPIASPVVPDYWMANPQPLPTAVGLNRFAWDLRYPAPPSLAHNYPISAIEHETPAEPLGPQVVPGTYRVQLTANGQTYTQPLVVRRDPREETSAAAFAAQLALAQRVTAAMAASYSDHLAVQAWANAPGGGAAQKKAARKLDQGTRGHPGFAALNRELEPFLEDVESADAAPTEAMQAAARQYQSELQALEAAWARLRAAGQ